MTLLQTQRFQNRTIKWVMLLAGSCLLAPLMSGCRSYNAAQGFPHNPIDTGKNIKERIADFIKQNYRTKYYATVMDDEKQKLRDAYVYDRKALHDSEYEIFVQRLCGVKNGKDFGKTIAVGTMGVVGGLVGGGTAQILSAASGATTLTDAAVDSVFFYNASLPAMKAGMDAARASAWVKLAAGLTNTVSGYSLASAESDMDAYYFAGTLVGASTEIQKISATKTTEAKQASSAAKENGDLAKETSKLDPAKEKPKIDANKKKMEINGEKVQKFLAQ